MTFIYFGSSKFSCLVLENLIERNIYPSLIVTQTDKPQKRGWKILPTPLGEFSQKNNLPIIKPLKLDEKIREELEQKKVDFFIVTDYGKIIPKNYLDLPKKMPLGLHPSLLPLYRGPAPINWVIINGEKETGVTVFRINEEVDKGDIVLQEKVSIQKDDNVISLRNKLAKEGAKILIEAMEKIEKNDYQLIPQDDKRSSFAPKLKKDDGRINWNKEATQIRNLIRGVMDWPSGYTYYKDKLIKIIEAEAIEETTCMEPSFIVKIDKEGIYVSTKKGLLKIRRLKPEGKKEMDAFSFVCGYRVKEGERFC
jgi:methionyl-tRNA formyltransferase